MKWLLDQQTGNLAYNLHHQDRTIAEAVYNPHVHSLRLYYSSKRVFFLERKGWFQTRVVFHNEYGLVVGETNYNRTEKEGVLQVGEKRFSYSLRPDGEATLFDEKGQQVAQCGISPDCLPDSNCLSVLLFSLAWLHLHDAAAVKSEPALVPAAAH